MDIKKELLESLSKLGFSTDESSIDNNSKIVESEKLEEKEELTIEKILGLDEE